MRPKWDRWDGIDFERLFLSYLGLEVGRAAKWDSGQTKRGTRMDAPLFHNLDVTSHVIIDPLPEQLRPLALPVLERVNG